MPGPETVPGAEEALKEQWEQETGLRLHLNEASVLKKVGDTVGKQAAMAVAASGAGISWPWRASSLLGLAAMQCVSVVLACHVQVRLFKTIMGLIGILIFI